ERLPIPCSIASKHLFERSLAFEKIIQGARVKSGFDDLHNLRPGAPDRKQMGPVEVVNAIVAVERDGGLVAAIVNFLDMEALYTGYLYHFICSFKLVNRGLPTTMWSSTSISSNFPASSNCLVTSISSGLGDGSELGWLCATIMLGQ